jgi:molecular chaperone GrpE
MPEPPPPGVAEGAAGRRAQALTPEAVEAVLADFRSWLQQLAEIPAAAPAEPEAESIDLHTLLGQFVALRHEVNLQTRAVRAQQEQSAEALQQLSAALGALQRAQSAPRPDEDEAIRPLLKTLVDLYDALALARREVQRVQEAAPEPAPEPPAVPQPPGTFWSRWFGGPAEDAGRERLLVEQERRRQAEEAARRVRQLLDSVLTGYTMSLQRLERALQQHGLEAIPSAGRPFDPERMEVLEVVTASGRPSGEVVEEVRRGYLWRGRVFRYAQVRVAKNG